MSTRDGKKAKDGGKGGKKNKTRDVTHREKRTHRDILLLQSGEQILEVRVLVRQSVDGRRKGLVASLELDEDLVRLRARHDELLSAGGERSKKEEQNREQKTNLLDVLLLPLPEGALCSSACRRSRGGERRRDGGISQR